MSHDAVQSIGALTGAEFAFYHVAVTDVLIRLPTGGFRHLRVLFGTAQNRSGELNATLLAPGDGFQVSVNLVCQHPRRVASVVFPVAFHSPEEIGGFVESIEGKPLNPGITVHHADVKLRAEFRVGMCLAPDDRPHPRLTDADDSIRGIDNLVCLEAKMANMAGAVSVTIRDLIRSALRMRPDRIIVGEVRGGEAVDMLQSLNTGHDGSLSTLHANSSQDMLSRIETMTLMGIDLPLEAIRRQIASGVDILVHLGRMRDKSRKLLEITEVCGFENGEIQTRPLYRWEEGKGLVKTGELLHCEKMKRAGIRL